MAEDGICIVGVPNAKSFHRLAAVKMGLLKSEYDLNSRDLELGHYRIYDLELLKNHMDQAGFKIKFESGIFLTRGKKNAKCTEFVLTKLLTNFLRSFFRAF